jgi:2Fe-2S ferredoxin
MGIEILRYRARANPKRSVLRSNVVPKIEVLASDRGPSASIDRPEGGALIDICDESGAPIGFSCRSANCGTCRVDVLEGAALLEPAAPEETSLLTILKAAPSHRLACRAKVIAAPGAIVLRWIGNS